MGVMTLFVHNYRVATLFTFYPTVSEITIRVLNRQDNYNMPTLINLKSQRQLIDNA